MRAKAPVHSAKPPPPAPPRDAAQALDTVEERRAKNRMARLRERLGKAVDDPVMAERMARYIRELLREGR
jgi:hypothetical protein